MQKLNLPEFNFEIKKEKNQLYIRDFIRKKYLLLTPEEWVRQHIIAFLVNAREFPATLLSVESGIQVNKLNKRYDALVYSRTGQPFVLIECKAPEVIINQKVFEQIIVYNSKISAPYMLITNGLKHFFLKINLKTGKFVFEQAIPCFNEMVSEV